MASFLNDRSFLLKLNQHKVREYLAAIMVLDFETENPIARLEGKVVSGSMTVAANSSVRKTCSLTIVFDDDTKNITDINNLIAIDKKVSISLGLKNPFYHTEQYAQYGEELWFKQGTFAITKASSSISTGSAQVSLELQDKMAFLNGTCGGVLPANTSFHDKIIYDKDGNYTTEYPLIKEIIYEAVHHYGGEHPSRIIIEDVPDVGRKVVRWKGTTPINFQSEIDAKNSGRSFVIDSPPIAGFSNTYYKGDLVGYMETPLTYPGELILKMGQNVTNLLDEIVSTLGNYEYFYDADGIFHFRQKKNYLTTGATPLNYDPTITVETVDSAGNISQQTSNLDKDLQNLYFPRYTEDEFINEFADKTLVSTVGYNPDYSKIKNDFICWGTRQNDSNTEVMVRYHLAIDVRPKDIPIPTTDEERELIGDNYSLCHKTIRKILNKDDGTISRYVVENTYIIDNVNEVAGEIVAPSLDEAFPDLDASYHFNWREELYRQALLAYGTSTEGSYYDEELMAEWRNIYDPGSTWERDGIDSFQRGWEDHFGEDNDETPWAGYIVDVKIAPEKLRYWLDIIDTSAAVGVYGVNRIGRRTVAQENSKINEVFQGEIPDIVFIENTGDPQQMIENTSYYISIGQAYSFINSDQLQYFQQVNSFGTCYEAVREMLYNNLIYNATASLSCIPILYLDVNKVVHLNFPELGITGDFVINNISMQFNQNPTMSLSLNEAIVIV